MVWEVGRTCDEKERDKRLWLKPKILELKDAIVKFVLFELID